MEKASRTLRTSNIQMAFFISNPLIVVNIINFARLQLNFFNILIASKCVDFLPVDSNCGKEAFLLEHGCLMEDVLLHKL